MADFICFEADASDDSNDEVEQMDIDDNLIDDSKNQNNNDPTFFRFHNQTTNIAQVLNKAAEIEEIAAEYLEANNYNNDDY